MRNDIIRYDKTGSIRNLNTRTTDVTIYYETDFLFPEDGFSFHWYKNSVANPHTHDFFEFILITEGKISHNLNDTMQNQACGTLLFIRPSDIHAIYPEETYTLINLSATEDKLRKLCSIVSPDLFEDLLALRCAGERVFLQEQELRWFINRAEQFTSLFSDPERHQHAQLLLAEMILSSISIFTRKRPSVQYPEWFSTLLTQINSADLQSLNANDVYKWSHYTPASIGRYFQLYLGETIISYIKRLKLNKACNLLLSTDFDVLTIASMLGYDSLSHFNRIFRLSTGDSPIAFRNKNRGRKRSLSAVQAKGKSSLS